MKHFAVLFFLLQLFVANAQKKSKDKWLPVLYLDSVRLKPISLFNTDKVEYFTEVNDNDSSAPGGKIFMTSKIPASFRFYTMAEIALKHYVTKDSPAIFRVDGRIVRDTSQFQIDSSYIIEIGFSDVENHLHSPVNNLNNLRFLNIKTQAYLEPPNRKKRKKEAFD